MRWLTEKRRWLPIYLALAAAWAAAYLIAAALLGDRGFPLDDAWIHQTYARNLALTGRLEFTPGQASAGSTAPLWTLLLAVGYLLRLPYDWWAWGMGVLCLALAGRLAHRVTARLFPDKRWIAPAVGLLCVSEWHLVWASVSGMETILYVVLSIALIDRLPPIFTGANGLKNARYPIIRTWAVIGLLGGLLVLTRPEGIVLVGLVALWGGWLVIRGCWTLRHAGHAAGAALVPLALLMAPYLLLNLHLSDRLWPNTLYAKQAEYAAQLAVPFLLRLARVAVPPLTGFQLLLVPGLLMGIWLTIRRGLSPSSLPSLPRFSSCPILLFYSVAHLLLYALRLPVTYQHGRYLVPVIPTIILYGVPGSLHWLRGRHPTFWRRVIGRSWLLATGILVLVFLVVGARAYAKDVQIIQSEMVTVARWLLEHTEPDEWIAAHDIGAIGYFAHRPILDLAGLVSPEVVPLIATEGELTEFILASPARYLVTAPGWPYEYVTRRPRVRFLYSTGSHWTWAEGLNNCAVYRLPASDRP